MGSKNTMEQTQHKISIIEDKTFENSLRLDDGYPRIFTVEEPYLLNESEYRILTKSTSIILVWAHTMLAGAAMYAISILARYIYQHASEEDTKVASVESLILAIAFVVAIFLEVIAALAPSDKRKIVKKIGKYFEGKQKFRGFLGK
jgi:hypothetical protein